MATLQRNLPERLERRLTAALVLGAVSLLAVLFYLPVGLVVSEALGPEGRPSLDAFGAILTDPFYVGALADVFADPIALARHARALREWAGAGFPAPGFGLFGFTAYQALLSTIASVLVGLPGAYVLSRFEFRGRRALRSLTIVPFVLPSIMVAVGFFAMFSAGGPLNRALGAAGLGPVSLLFTLEAIVLAHAFYNAPLVARVVAAAWESVDGRTIETARSLGASRRRALLDVVAPQLLPAILVGAVLAFIFTFMSFPIVLALGGLELATVEVWVYDRVRNLAYTEAAALATLESLLSIALLYLYLRYEARVASAGRGRPLPRQPLVSGWRSVLRPSRIALAAYGVVVLVLFVGPITSLLLESLTNSSGFTLRHYAFLLERQASAASYQTRPLPAIRNSLVFAAGTLVLALPLGLGVAVLSTGSLPGRTVLGAVAMLPLAVSGVVLGIGLLRGLVFGISLPFGYRFGLTGPVAIVAAHAVAAYPFVTRTVAPLLAGLDDSLVETARSLGASRARAFVDVELPRIAPGIAAGAAFALAISIGEFNSTVLLAQGSDGYTMPVAIERYLGRRSLGPATAMGTVLLVVTSVSFVLVDRLGGGFRG